MEKRSNKELSAQERKEEFHEWFGDRAVDASYTLHDLVQKAGDYLGQIVGKENADAGMSVMLKPATGDTSASAWREELEVQMSGLFSEWPLGARLHDIAAYAHYGFVLHSEDDMTDIAAFLEQEVSFLVAFLEASPISQWLHDRSYEDNELALLVTLAKNRWALDNGKPIEPLALAYFGGVSEARVRNMMAGKQSKFTNTDGKVPAHEALAWLSDRESFFDSIWRDQPTSWYAPTSEESVDEPYFVPVARDGTIFHPGIARAKGYQIGPKGDERYLESFDDALGELQRMQIPYWRRPNEKGRFGIVRGVAWERFDKNSLAARSVRTAVSET